MKTSNAIDNYVTDLRRKVARIKGSDDIVDEAEDHLLAAADALKRSGMPTAEAETRAVADYGDTRTVVRGFKRASRQRGAIATRLTRLGGIACMALPFLLFAGLTLNGGAHGDEPAHSLGVIAEVLLYPTLLASVAALVKRHGGLGRIGWLMLVALAVSPLLVFPLSYFGVALAMIIYAVVFGVLSVTLYRAAILPRPAVLVAFSAPLVYAVVALVVALTGGDTKDSYYIPIFVVLAAFAWFGWAMWKEKPLDQAPVRRVAAP